MGANRSPELAFHAAVKAAGSQSQLARLLGVGQPTLWKWLRINKRLPAEHVLKVEAETGISRHELRPDLYPIEDPSSVRHLPLAGSIGSCERAPEMHLGESVR